MQSPKNHACPNLARYHLCTCSNIETTKTLNKGVDQLEIISKETDMDRNIYLVSLDSFIKDLTHTPTLLVTIIMVTEYCYQTLCMRDQQKIGWINFFLDRLGVKWKEA